MNQILDAKGFLSFVLKSCITVTLVLPLLLFLRVLRLPLASSYSKVSLLASTVLNEASCKSWLSTMLIPMTTWSDSEAVRESGMYTGTKTWERKERKGILLKCLVVLALEH